MNPPSAATAHHPLQPTPEPAARTLHDSSVHGLHCLMDGPLQSLPGMVRVLVGDPINFAPDEVV